MTFGIYSSSLPQINDLFNNGILSHHQLIFLPYMICFAIFQLIYGFLSDFYGRRSIILIGLFIFIMGSIYNSLSTSLLIFMISFGIQGIGGSYAGTLSRAIQRDLFEGPKYFIWGSYMAMSLSLISMCSPLLGTFIQIIYPVNFQANIWFIVIYSSFIFIVAFVFFPETNNCIQKYFKWDNFYRKYLDMLKNDRFLKFSICGGLSYVNELTYFLLFPAIFKIELHYTNVEYGLITWIIISGFLVGSFISSQLNKVFYFYNNIILGYIIILVSILIIIYLYCSDSLSIYNLVPLMWVYMLASGIIAPNISSGAIHLFKSFVGAASSLYCSLQFLVGALSIITVYFFDIHSLFKTMLFLFIINILTFIYFIFFKKKLIQVNNYS